VIPNIVAARSQMGISLAFHIIFACMGIAMPLLMVLAESLYRIKGDDVYLLLARRWATGTAILFAVGAVSGTVLSLELGLLWPHFMEWAGPIIGMPFSLEGFAFFTEAIFLGLYMYGWDRLPAKAHIAAGYIVAFSGMISGVFVVMANAWMNTPVGFRLDSHGHPFDINPIAALTNPAAFHEVLHMTIAAYAASGFAVAGVHSFMLLRDRGNLFHRHAVTIALLMGCIAAPLQPLTGDWSARAVADYQPLKLAAFEGLFETQRGAPLAILGIPNIATRHLDYAIELPYLLSLMTYHDPHALVLGLDSFPEKDWPNPLAAVHIAFQAMVGIGFAMAAIPLWALWLLWRKRTVFDSVWFLRALVAATAIGFVAVEAGWVVTEVGRQPWIIYHVMLTHDAITPMPRLGVQLVVFSSIYVFLGLTVLRLMGRHVMRSPDSEEIARLLRRRALSA
jgi:cytochrome bd ubiquinol oxidase subunit I